MTDEAKRAMLNSVLDRIGPDGIGQLVIEQHNTIHVGQKMPTQMPPYLSVERTMEIYHFLISGCFIEASTPSENFIYLMGASSCPPQKLKPIIWKTTVQQLRTMLTLAFDEPIKRGAVLLAEIERRAVECFLNKGEKMRNLAKPTNEISYGMESIVRFFRPNQ